MDGRKGLAVDVLMRIDGLKASPQHMLQCVNKGWVIMIELVSEFLGDYSRWKKTITMEGGITMKGGNSDLLSKRPFHPLYCCASDAKVVI